jgi:hypothetical protein
MKVIQPNVSAPNCNFFSGISLMSGDDLETIIRKYIEEDESRVDWPCWELNDHDAISSQGDFGNF